jgi:quercetin dioxygenase-like cupin family protein
LWEARGSGRESLGAAYCGEEAGMGKLRAKRWLVLGVLAFGGAAFAVGVAVGAVTSTVVKDTNTVREKIVQSVVTDGFDSGWHIHPGPAIVQVQDGQIKIYQGDCSPRVLNAGDTYIEIPGVPVDAVIKDAATWTTTFILPDSAPGAPDRVATTSPC